MAAEPDTIVFVVVARSTAHVAHDAELAAFAQVVDEHGAAVLGMLRRLCGNRHDADDAFQETALRVWRNLQGRPRLHKPRAWLMTIAYHVFADQRAKNPRHEVLVEHADPRPADPAQWIESADDNDRVQRHLNQLPDAIRSVVVLHYAGGLTLRQTATVLEISVGTTKSRLNNALERLRRVLP
jgi:RNA polymerase sigma-70 factor (ECF subfamily)